jgi:tetratricopeptide (TPR) repeat protein
VSNKKTLFVIDSIPLINDPEDWNPITAADIADITIVSNKDSLKLLGWEELDAITYIFTKAYRNRPDSIKRIPSLKQMKMKNQVWTFHDSVYSGEYIDYYNSGRTQNEGTLLNGKLNGELTVYFKNGNKKLVSNYRDGILDGTWSEYYPNGVLMNSREYTNGRVTVFGKHYFINGQVMSELKQKRATAYDTAISYYSTGKVKQLKLIRDGKPVPDKKTDDLNYYTTYFYQSVNMGDLKTANKHFYKIWKIDSTSSDSHFKEGLLLLKEFRFDAAIDQFDKAIQLEPLMRESLVHRALTRIKKYKYSNATPKNKNESPLTLEDFISIPDHEQVKICNDLRQAQYVDFSELYVQKIVPALFLEHCRKQGGQ